MHQAFAYDVFGAERIEPLVAPEDLPAGDFAQFRFEQAADCFQGSGFAGAVGTKERDHLAGRYFQRDAAKHEDDAVVD